MMAHTSIKQREGGPSYFEMPLKQQNCETQCA